MIEELPAQTVISFLYIKLVGHVAPAPEVFLKVMYEFLYYQDIVRDGVTIGKGILLSADQSREDRLQPTYQNLSTYLVKSDT